MEKAKRLTVKQASEILDINQEALRTAMKEGVLPIGSVVKNKKEYSFLIYEEKIHQYLYGGITPDQEEILDKIIDYINRLKKQC